LELSTLFWVLLEYKYILYLFQEVIILLRPFRTGLTAKGTRGDFKLFHTTAHLRSSKNSFNCFNSSHTGDTSKSNILRESVANSNRSKNVDSNLFR